MSQISSKRECTNELRCVAFMLHVSVISERICIFRQAHSEAMSSLTGLLEDCCLA